MKLDRDNFKNSSALLDFLEAPTRRSVRGLTDADLAAAKEARGAIVNTRVVVAIVDLEIARRAAWRGPARWAVAIGVVALIVAAFALTLAWDQERRPEPILLPYVLPNL